MGYSYEGTNQYTDFPVAIKISTALPLDVRSIFGSLAEAEKAAKNAKPTGSTDSIYYYGMPITVVENGRVDSYNITPDNSLQPVGKSIYVADNESITIRDTEIKMKNFGEKYYKYIPSDNIIKGEFKSPSDLPNINEKAFAKINLTWYENVPGFGWKISNITPNESFTYKEIVGWKEGLEPRVTLNDGKYSISWYEPSPETLDGLNLIITDMKNQLDISKNIIKENINNIGDINNRLTNIENEPKGIKQLYDSLENGHIIVDGKDIEVYKLPIGGVNIVGGLSVDNETIKADEKGTISIKNVDINKIEGLSSYVNSIKMIAVMEANDFASQNFINKNSISKSYAIDTKNPSDDRVISEKAFVECLSWKKTI